jgi:hypothetical protein
MRVSFRINGDPVAVDVEPRLHLADCLRDVLRLTGTHLGCEHGACGACTVIVDGAAVRACLMLTVQAEGASVVTVEGLSMKRQICWSMRCCRGSATVLVLYAGSDRALSRRSYLTWTDEISSVTVAYQGLHDDRSVADSLIASPRRALVSPAR